ncbi:unnamed protein product [Bursaphelenchus xylophilus]|nr:unnamed protein product [Bursaphelenchus xylophilus]CAG9125714.1 unnamed protein product [Bursaphelenchus xylophilus]
MMVVTSVPKPVRKAINGLGVNFSVVDPPGNSMQFLAVFVMVLAMLAQASGFLFPPPAPAACCVPPPPPCCTPPPPPPCGGGCAPPPPPCCQAAAPAPFNPLAALFGNGK